MIGKRVIGLCVAALAVLVACPAFSKDKGTPTEPVKVIEEEGEDRLDAQIEEFAIGEPPTVPYQGLSPGSTLQSLNPDVSVIIDTFYHNDDTPEGIDEIFGEMAGFGHVHGPNHSHEHARLDDGFNLRHLELCFAGEVDPYFKAYAIAAISEEDAELEEAVIKTTGLPAGLQIQAGKFFSHFGRINSQHSHEWDFVDQALIYRLTLGDHGLNEKGVQLSWLAPTPFYLLAGVEAFQGENELLFSHIGDENLPDREGPRLWTGWIKFSPNLPRNHGMQAGLFGAQGVHQEAHDGNDDGTEDHWLKGYGRFWGADLVYKYDSGRNYGHGDFTFQSEYIYRIKDLSVHRHDLVPEFTGRDRGDKQDGYYVQAVYCFQPRWRVGLRWDQVGLTNKSEYPDGSRDDFDDSQRLATMLDFTSTEFSRLRLQISQGEYDLGKEDEEAWQCFLQLTISLGAHGAHKF
jgi:hypothetical protein